MIIDNIEVVNVFDGYVICLRLTGWTLWWTGPKLHDETQRLTDDNWSTSSEKALRAPYKDVALEWRNDIVERREHA